MQGTKTPDLEGMKSTARSNSGSKSIVGGLEGEDMFHRTDNPDRVVIRQAADPCSLAARYARTDMRKYSFGVRVTDFWNRLEPEIRDSMINKQFKTQLKAKIVPLVGTVHNVLERRLENTNYRICLKVDGRVMKLDNRRQSEAYHESKDVSTTCLQWHT